MKVISRNCSILANKLTNVNGLIVKEASLGDLNAIKEISQTSNVINGFKFDHVSTNIDKWMNDDMKKNYVMKIGEKVVGYRMFDLIDDGRTLW